MPRLIAKCSAYRAPELLFGARNYDPIAIDLWSLGACLAEIFTSLRLCCDDMDDDQDDSSQDEKDENRAFLVPQSSRIGDPDSYWKRDSLFEGSRGEIGIAWSIFKIFGTPTKDNWPVSKFITVFRVFNPKFSRNSKNCLVPSPSSSMSCPASLSRRCFQTSLRHPLCHRHPQYWIFLSGCSNIHPHHEYRRKMLLNTHGSQRVPCAFRETTNLIIQGSMASIVLNIMEGRLEIS
jgi:LSD1 subclass zinc finger protein